MLKAVLFDAGGTLLKPRASVGEIYAEHARRQGVAVDASLLEDRFATAFRNAPPLAFPGADADALPGLEYGWWRDIVQKVFCGEHFADFEDFLRGLFNHFASANAWVLFDDVLATLTVLRECGFALGVVSNFDSRLFRICRDTGIAAFFDVTIASSRAGAAKPDPRIFRSAIDQLGVEPGQALHVGDSLLEDVRGARAAGLRAVLVDRNSIQQQGGDVISDLRHLSPVVAATR